MYGFFETPALAGLRPSTLNSSVPAMLGSKIRLILPFAVYFIAGQALVATQNLDQIKASSEAGCSTACRHGWWSWGGRRGSSSAMLH